MNIQLHRTTKAVTVQFSPVQSTIKILSAYLGEKLAAAVKLGSDAIMKNVNQKRVFSCVCFRTARPVRRTGKRYWGWHNTDRPGPCMERKRDIAKADRWQDTKASSRFRLPFYTTIAKHTHTLRFHSGAYDNNKELLCVQTIIFGEDYSDFFT